MKDTLKHSNRNEFPDIIIDDHEIDLIMVRKKSNLDYGALFEELCDEVSNEKSLYVFRVDKNKIENIEQLYQSLYLFLFKVPLSRDFEMAEMLEILEDEVGELHTCVVAVEDFDSFPLALRKSFLELIIVTDSFKLLISVEKDFDLKEQSERLWSVLKSRCTEINFGSSDMATDNNDYDDQHEEENFSINIKADEDDFNEEVDNHSQQQESKAGKTPISPWYNMVPRYHLAAAVILAVLMLFLWQMDFSTKKAETVTVEVELDRSAFIEDVEQSAETSQEFESGEVDLSAQQGNVSATNEISASGITQDPMLAETLVESVPVDKPAEAVQKADLTTQAKVEPKVAAKAEPKPAPKPVPKPAVKVAKKKIDWSPYQSNKWISELNKNYFTLQLMATHEEKGIRDFLKKNGVNSQYAVYTTQKDGRDWHVVIYGTYQTREAADQARTNLPSYLKSLNPWIRTVADVQKSVR